MPRPSGLHSSRQPHSARSRKGGSQQACQALDSVRRRQRHRHGGEHGANGTIASDFVAKSLADGYTLLMGGSSTHSSAPSLFKALPYDPERDFEMIANVVESQFMLVVRAESRRMQPE